jgi:hypothetical protein
MPIGKRLIIELRGEKPETVQSVLGDIEAQQGKAPYRNYWNTSKSFKWYAPSRAMQQIAEHHNVPYHYEKVAQQSHYEKVAHRLRDSVAVRMSHTVG